MPTFVAAVDLSLDLLACAVALALVAVVLFAGWVTRTMTVVALSICLNGMAAVLLGTWIAYRFDNPNDPVFQGELAIFRLVAGTALILVLLAIWTLLKLLRRQRATAGYAMPTFALAESPERRFNRDWLLSLLHERAVSSREKFAIPFDQAAASDVAPKCASVVTHDAH